MGDIKKPVILRLPPDLVSRVDARASKRGISRNEWFVRMVTWVLENREEK